MPPTAAFRLLRFIGCAVAAAGLAACATQQPVEWRLQVRTVADWPDPQALSQRAEQIAGVPVSPEVAAIAPHWYAITLQCEDRATCKRASMKLAAQPALFVELRRDDTRALPKRPNSQNSQ
ncbi:hypothetical protein [Ideonella sp. BN130291]|uniref:hypothetical protein n=1 Tax=Ideonella sp. BN130291 TaxID=3112940 RepID=UPI002E2668A0|nr:hypothetical protein [Ideonella sp. BN130291]